MKRDSVLALVGIAKKAGKVAAGEFQTEQAVKSGKAYLVIVSSEASENTKKKFRNMCAFYEIPVVFYGGKEQLGKAVGCEFRASLAVTDEGLSRSIEKKLLQFASERDAGGKADGNIADSGKKPECEGRRYEYGED